MPTSHGTPIARRWLLRSWTEIDHEESTARHARQMPHKHKRSRAEETYDVEALLEEEQRQGKAHFLVRWQG